MAPHVAQGKNAKNDLEQRMETKYNTTKKGSSTWNEAELQEYKLLYRNYVNKQDCAGRRAMKTVVGRKTEEGLNQMTLDEVNGTIVLRNENDSESLIKVVFVEEGK